MAAASSRLSSPRPNALDLTGRIHCYTGSWSPDDWGERGTASPGLSVGTVSHSSTGSPHRSYRPRARSGA